MSDDKQQSSGILRRTWDTINWVPPLCRYDPKNPPKLTMALNILFGIACTFTVANLYYSHPLLEILAVSFNISQERASLIPTVAQAGYATGLLFLCPLGDIVRRRPFVLLLMAFTATISLGLCLTKSFEAFVALNFIMSVTTVTPQIMLPLVGQLAAPNRRATAIAIVVSGLLLGILIARLLSGIIANYSSWRNVYWMSFALQYLILILLWFLMPDYPQSNTGLNYFRMLFSILEIIVKYPLLVQSCLIGFFVSSTFTSFWTTLTFLLSDDPYNYSTIVIGLFALAGIVPMFFGPFFARHVTDKFDTHVSVLMGQGFCLIGIIIGTFTGKISVAGPIVQAIIFDFGQQISQVANRTAVYSVEPKAASRVNTAYMLCVFCGQLMGTAAGNHLYASGGWVLSGGANIGFMGAAMVILLLRGPKETGWVGWRGGIDLRRNKREDKKDGKEETGEGGGVREEQDHDPEKGKCVSPEQDAQSEAEKKGAGNDID
ncbi:major facilitator superfamily domain-containing protein [Talaromyces proteolyticus]|uniref:Major facilitator superfamily domain-containing protein n=1 Tax=Talaromyces proteolyticus TaxID=1131652 RepID=A0AAD4KIE0_9EURO|nr:major facilitator superfamily domain-containing protein [Talaromyces proteolyticus]KAH8689066.1 major facilitator superfamily domain-containing protein [Talaromyces proteolyticus]